MDRTPFVIVALVTLAAPAAAWSGYGAWEPDTPQDVRDQRMWLQPDVDPNPGHLQVYFNAYPMLTNQIGGGANPNVGGAQTRLLAPTNMAFSAFLGIWKDCNQDGYIGHAETVLLEYRSELLLDASVCPDGGRFNAGGWVTEFLWIGDATGTEGKPFPRLVNDTEAKVWADFGRPNVASDVHFDCLQYPLPTGTLESTGGLLQYADCQIGYNVAKNVNAVDDETGLGLRFDDPYHPEQDCDSALNQPLPGGGFGRDPCREGGALAYGPTEDRPAALLFDCDNGQDVPVVVEDEELAVVRVPALAQQPLRDPTTGSWSATLDNAYRATADGCADDEASNGVSGWWFLLDGGAAGTNPTDGKRFTDGEMGFGRPGNISQEPTLGWSACTSFNPLGTFTTVKDRTGADLAQAPLCPLAQQGPEAAGTNAYHRIWFGRGWNSGFVYIPPTYLGGTLRHSDLSPAGGMWFTAYARVGTGTFAAGGLLPPNAGLAVYGADACGNDQSGVRNGWDCDASHWVTGTRPGAHYQLRDIDCYDGALVSGVAYASLALLDDQEGTCP